MSRAFRVGVISDTHGVVPEAVHDAFRDVDHIVHAGDIGGPHVLAELELLAPVTAVLGNTDHDCLPGVTSRARVTLSGVSVEVVHDVAGFTCEPPSPEAAVLITGHTHLPVVGSHGAALHVNPGSAVHPRGGMAPSVAVLTVEGNRISAAILTL